MKYYRKKGLSYCLKKSLNFKSKSDRNINKNWFLLFFPVCRFWRLIKHFFYYISYQNSFDYTSKKCNSYAGAKIQLEPGGGIRAPFTNKKQNHFAKTKKEKNFLSKLLYLILRTFQTKKFSIKIYTKKEIHYSAFSIKLKLKIVQNGFVCDCKFLCRGCSK